MVNNVIEIFEVTIHEHGGHLGNVSRNICTNFGFPTLRSLQM